VLDSRRMLVALNAVLRVASSDYKNEEETL
jgi:hypothetical protein